MVFLVGKQMLRYLSEPERFREWIGGYGFRGKLIYMAMVFLQVVLAVIPGEPLETFGGYAFGALEGTVLCGIAAALGSLAVFFLVRRFGMRLASFFFAEERLRSLRFLKTTPKRSFLLMLIFMIPGTPKDLISYYAGLTDIRPGIWLFICTVGRLPSIVSSTVGGSAIGDKSYPLAAAVFGAALLVSVLGFFIYNRICAAHEDKPPRKDKDGE